MFSDDILKWYDENRRVLPWRGTREVYRIWLSEIMLQQTQAETVKGYYGRFLARFPTVEALAAADEGEVLKLWEGLGYYSRARNLHAAAKAVAAAGGVFPKDAAGLRGLKGVGPYAANAIASIAYGEAVPALDGNQARVLSRVLAWEDEIRTPFDLVGPAAEMMSRERPGDYNQALMDLGAMVCVPKSPRCGGCPVAGYCVAYREDAVLEYPQKPAPVAKRRQDWTIVVLTVDGRTVVRRRPKGLLGGLYEFVAVEGHHEGGALVGILEEMGFWGVELKERLRDSRHVFTHLVWEMEGWKGVCDGVPEGFEVVEETEMRGLAFPRAMRGYF